MRIVIYNSSSFGGCFDYGKALYQAYGKHPEVESVSWWVPANSELPEDPGIRKLILSDKIRFRSKWLKQLHFLFRILVNPIRLLNRLRMQPPSVVLFNDFEQLTAFVWVPLFRWFLGEQHVFGVLLHDPDRDAYPPSLRFSQWSMRTIMGLMDIGIYHDFLPEKPYYQQLPNCRFIELPHGFYPMPEPDPDFLMDLSRQLDPQKTIITIPGNIREEKNYHLAIEALTHLPNHMLLVAGSAANARVDINRYKIQARELGVENRLVWIDKFLSEAELSAVIEAADVVALNYSVSFTSQSGILNVVAPFRKELVVSDGPSSLANVLKKFHVGELVEPDSVASLVEGLKKLETEEAEVRHQWEDYLAYASWSNHVDKAIALFKTLKAGSL